MLMINSKNTNEVGYDTVKVDLSEDIVDRGRGW